MHAFTVHPPKPAAVAPAKPTDPKDRRRRWRRRLALLLLLLLIGGLFRLGRPDPHLVRAKELQAELFSPEAKNLSPDERKAKFEQFRGVMKQLTEEQKRLVFAPV